MLFRCRKGFTGTLYFQIVGVSSYYPFFFPCDRFIVCWTHLVPVTYLSLDPFLQSFIHHCISGSKEFVESGSWGMVLAVHRSFQDTIGARLLSAVAGGILGEAKVWSTCGYPVYTI